MLGMHGLLKPAECKDSDFDGILRGIFSKQVSVNTEVYIAIQLSCNNSIAFVFSLFSQCECLVKNLKLNLVFVE